MITGKKQIWPTLRRIYEKSDSVRRNFTWSVEGRVSFYCSIKQLQWKVGAGSRRLNPLCEPEIIFCTNTGRNKVPPVLSNRTMATVAHLQSAPTWCTTFKVENFANGRERASKRQMLFIKCRRRKLLLVPPDIYRNRKNSALHKSVFGGGSGRLT